MRLIRFIVNWLAFFTIPLWVIPVGVCFLFMNLYDNYQYYENTVLSGKRWFWQ